MEGETAPVHGRAPDERRKRAHGHGGRFVKRVRPSPRVFFLPDSREDEKKKGGGKEKKRYWWNKRDQKEKGDPKRERKGN